MINYKLDELDWDIVMPMLRPCLATMKGFDTQIKKLYSAKYPRLDGVLWLNDGVQKDINTFPVVGRLYYNDFDYIYNPIYTKKNFEKEFTEVNKLSKKVTFINSIFFKNLRFGPDDDKIYDLRRRNNFGLDLWSSLK
jgi:hypothetical protein